MGKVLKITIPFPMIPLTRSHVAEILFTSGTTSEPRGVVLTHGNFLANLEPWKEASPLIAKYERWFHPLRFVTLVPLSHVFGQFMALFVPPLLGAGIVLERRQAPAEIMRSIKRERAVALIAVPRMMESLRSGLEREMGVRGQQSASAHAGSLRKAKNSCAARGYFGGFIAGSAGNSGHLFPAAPLCATR